ncbi:hypothetical protein [Arthrobacter sp. P2b]|jgi:hypothetical protein|uniref:hypothetical protein n=1 Tax=Arthrobacter sp. P2b TaxID=1938741 RepID=UPI0009A58E34|nr:hypothetical protein [Arthrobacter sp. P2b]SLJ92309.1 hypothetical protein SAMN06272721_101374 [Arthrobacter sp. P2b]
MSEYDAYEEPRQGSPAPGLEGEGGDYGDTGSVESPTENLADGEYPDGDYGPAGTVGSARQEDSIRERLTDGQVNTTAEERGPLHGDGNVER